jgi:general secretion pathway protein J
MTQLAPHRTPSRTGDGGFSLMEMLVSLVILALILAFLPGAFRLARQVWTATATLDRDTGRDAGLDFLETRLTEAMPLFEPGRAGLVNILFTGRQDKLRFIAPSQNGPAGGGLYSYTIELRPQGTGASIALVVAVAPYFGPAPESPDHVATTNSACEGCHKSSTSAGSSLPGDEQVLADDIVSAGFRYFGRHELRQTPAWQPEWKRTDALPDLVELSFARAHAGGTVSRSIVTELRLRRPS